jgi:hypothetical protein
MHEIIIIIQYNKLCEEFSYKSLLKGRQQAAIAWSTSMHASRFRANELEDQPAHRGVQHIRLVERSTPS